MQPHRSQQHLADDEEAPSDGCQPGNPQLQAQRDDFLVRWSAWLLMVLVVLIILCTGKVV